MPELPHRSAWDVLSNLTIGGDYVAALRLACYLLRELADDAAISEKLDGAETFFRVAADDPEDKTAPAIVEALNG